MFIETKDLKKSYGEGGSYVQVLKGVSIRIDKGEMCVIQGTSGSGKSTLLNCIGGLDDIDSGSVGVAGTLVENMRGEKLSDYRRDNLGFIFQFYNLLPSLTAYENVALTKTIVKNADIFIVIGTSLVVYPAAGLVGYAHPEVPKFLIDPSEMEGHMPLGFKHIKANATEGVDILLEELEKI